MPAKTSPVVTAPILPLAIKERSFAFASALRAALEATEGAREEALLRAVQAGKMVHDTKAWLKDNPLILQSFDQWFRSNVKGFKRRTADDYQRIYIFVTKNCKTCYRNLQEVRKAMPRRKRTTFDEFDKHVREQKRRELIGTVDGMPDGFQGRSPKLGSMEEMLEESEDLAKSHDFYATDEASARYLPDRETFKGPIWEPCSGDGALVEVLQSYKHKVKASDIRGEDVYGKGGVDLFSIKSATNVVTNPPYSNVFEVAKHLVGITKRKCALLLPMYFMGTVGRRGWLIANPPARYYPLPFRPKFRVGGRKGGYGTGYVDYGWYVWQKGFKGRPEIMLD